MSHPAANGSARGRAVRTGLLAALVVTLSSFGILTTVKQMRQVTPTVRTTPTATQPPATPTVTLPPTPLPSLPALSVRDAQLLANGHPLTLVGVDHSSLEYLCSGDGHFAPSDFAAMHAWGANAVRITLSSEFWTNPAAACATYQQTVVSAVHNAESAGLYVILVLQWSAPFDQPQDRTHGGVQCPMPDANRDLRFWTQVAQDFSTDPGVLFDLYGEPFSVAWAQWRDGGPITSGCYVITGPTNTMEHGTYQAIGMAPLVAAVRAVAPNNIIVVPGVNWGYDLSGIGQGFALHATNLVYDTHPFDYGNKQPSDWDRAFGAISAQVPVIAGEFGAYDCTTGYIGTAIAYFNAHHISWLAWTWGTGSCTGPSLLASWPATPSAPYGAFIRTELLAVAARRGAN
jgi:endoglucanase